MSNNLNITICQAFFLLDTFFFSAIRFIMDGVKLEFDLSLTQRNYVFSKAVVNAIISNTGEGKSFASVVAMVIHAQRCKRPIRAAIVRDTLENIKLSTARTIQEAFVDFPQYIYFRNEFKQLTIYSDPPVEVDLFGIDDPGALSKLQGPEYALIWLEEPAPMSDRANAGLSEEVFNASLVRATRQKGTLSRLQISMNPADEDHWSYKRLIEDEMIDVENPLITKAVFNIPYGENIHVSEVSRQAVKAAYKHDPSSYARYVEGRFASVFRGAQVTPQYKEERHLAREVIVPATGLPSFAFFDSWHNPSCVLGQITPSGRLFFIDTLVLGTSDIRTLLDTLVIPMINSPKWKNKPSAWRVGGDFSMAQPDQSNILETAARVVLEFFRGSSFESGPSKWKTIEQTINSALGRSDMRGEPLILLSKDNKILNRGLKGAWHYKTNNAGQIISTVPLKDAVSHPCDAWANAVSVILPRLALDSKAGKYRQQAAKAKQRAQSYSNYPGAARGGGFS